jgi:N-acetylneuraminic acid mutarotase
LLLDIERLALQLNGVREMAQCWLGALLAASVALSAHGQGGRWETLAPMPTARQELAAAVLDGKIYVIGGLNGKLASTATVEVYNPNTNSWSTARSIPAATNHNSAATAAGKLYAFATNGLQAYVYDAAADAWSTVAPMNFQHGGTAAVAVIDGKIYVAGGINDSNATNAVEVYDPAANTWTVRAPMSVPRHHTAGAAINGKFYVVAGRGSTNAPTALEVYDPATNSWATRAPMPTGRSGVAAAAVNGELWVFGGESPNRLHGEVEAYNPATNTWRSLPNMPFPRHGIWAAVVGDRIFIAGGGDVANFGATGHTDMFVVDRKATLGNISARARVETGDNVLIGGFIVTGSGSKRILVRAVGPSVPVEGTLGNPTLELYNGAGALIASNDNWTDSANRQQITDSALAPLHGLEAAILTELAPGNHTAIVRGAGATSGIALVEVFDLEAGSPAKLGNISARARVQTGDDVLIGGVIVTGTEPANFLVRAVGPSVPLNGALADPWLQLFDANGTPMAANDNWRSTQEAEITATGLRPLHDLEAAILRSLGPGRYTAIVRGVGDSSGIGLVEAYSVD